MQNDNPDSSAVKVFTYLEWLKQKDILPTEMFSGVTTETLVVVEGSATFCWDEASAKYKLFSYTRGTFLSYQLRSGETAVYTQSCKTLLHRLAYVGLGVASEGGEVAGKVKKFFRGDYGDLESPQALETLRESVRGEIGGNLWYLAQLCEVLKLNLGEIAEQNLQALADRAGRNVIRGDGDNR